MNNSLETPLYSQWKIFEKYNKRIQTGFTSRTGGFSKDPYGTFNQALHCGDNTESVIQNRRALCKGLNIPFGNYTCADQVHGNGITIVNQSNCGSGRENHRNSISRTDALIVTEPGILINIHTADCVPLAIYDFEKNIGALIHAGWKGTASLIAEKTIRLMIKELLCSPEKMIAAIGPAIGKCCFKIEDETAAILRNSFHYSDAVIHGEQGEFNADLQMANKEQLIHMGLNESSIETTRICTSCANSEYYSYRADKGKTGRQAAFMFLK